MIETIFHWMEQLYEALGSTTQLSPWVYLLVMTGGLASAISPCYTPVLAMFGGYIGGYAGETRTGGLRLAVPFVLGNAVTLAIAGAIASLLGRTVLQIFTGYQLDRWIPGIIGLVMAMQLFGILQLNLPAIPIFRLSKQPATSWGSFVLGLPFGLVVTPCTMPIFFAIVTFVALQVNVFHGVLLMVVYALGRGVVLTAVAAFVGLFKALNVGRISLYVERLCGLLILVASLGLLFFYHDYVQLTRQWMARGM